ncbi:MAG: site-specific integrase [Clostridia bacterium]|nr:site-specific integrase [Clostridia bacterium]
MASYRERKQNAKKRQIEDYLLIMPKLFNDYILFLDGKTEETKFTYLFDMKQLMEHLVLSEKIDKDISDFTLRDLTGITSDDINSWLDSLRVKDRVSGEMRPVTDSYRMRKLSAIRMFYSFLNEAGLSSVNPVLEIHRPKNNKKSPLTIRDSDIRKLIDGVKRNDLFLSATENKNGKKCNLIVPISYQGKIRRERQVSRNAAILSLILYCGLTVSEIASLQLDDVHLDTRTLDYERRNGTQGKISLPDEVVAELSEYIYGNEIPEDIKKHFTSFPSFDEAADFCRKNIIKPDITFLAAERFGNRNDSFLDDINTIAHFIRTSGRRAFSPHENEKSLFLSNSGSRISIRMIQQMILDMTRTYLPEIAEDRNFNASSLRTARSMDAGNIDVLINNFGMSRSYAIKQLRKSEKKNNI